MCTKGGRAAPARPYPATSTAIFHQADCMAWNSSMVRPSVRIGACIWSAIAAASVQSPRWQASRSDSDGHGPMQTSMLQPPAAPNIIAGYISWSRTRTAILSLTALIAPMTLKMSIEVCFSATTFFTCASSRKAAGGIVMRNACGFW
nr:hypothetical protein [Pseudonocardia sp.]